MTERAASSAGGAGFGAGALASVPAELKAEARWVCWRREERGGKVTKLNLNLPRFRLHPYAAIGRHSSPGQLARSNSSGLG